MRRVRIEGGSRVTVQMGRSTKSVFGPSVRTVKGEGVGGVS